MYMEKERNLTAFGGFFAGVVDKTAVLSGKSIPQFLLPPLFLFSIPVYFLVTVECQLSRL